MTFSHILFGRVAIGILNFNKKHPKRVFFWCRFYLSKNKTFSSSILTPALEKYSTASLRKIRFLDYCSTPSSRSLCFAFVQNSRSLFRRIFGVPSLRSVSLRKIRSAEWPSAPFFIKDSFGVFFIAYILIFIQHAEASLLT